MVELSRASRARPHGGRVFGRCPRGPRNGEGSVSMRFWGAVSGAVEAVWDSRWARRKPFLGARRPFALRRFIKKCTCPAGASKVGPGLDLSSIMCFGDRLFGIRVMM